MKRPVDPITLVEAAGIVGSSTSNVHRLVVGGRLPSSRDRYQHASAASDHLWHLTDPRAASHRPVDVHGRVMAGIGFTDRPSLGARPGRFVSTPDM